ncbi:MAG: hypothetical protein R3325_02805 [Thermoanaerobaculia bacterium]|nr:hypothetical protein [Thermoanaerobaculia bacterium]
MPTRNPYVRTEEDAVIYRVHPGSPTLLDIDVEVAEICVVVNQAKMTYRALGLVSNLGLGQGLDWPSLEKLRGQLDAVATAAHLDPLPVEVSMTGDELGPGLEIDVGPMCMYATELSLRTSTGRTFRELLSETVDRRNVKGALFALTPIRMPAGGGHGGMDMGTAAGAAETGMGHGGGSHG